MILIINNEMLWRIFDIKYECTRADLPTEIIIDLDKFSDNVDRNMCNINHKASKAIHNIAGCKSFECKVELYK
jgi:hypothetical protein